MLDYYNQIAEDIEDSKKRQEVFLRLDSVVKNRFPFAKLIVFGSCAVGLGSKKSDIDACVVMKDCPELGALKEEHGEDDYKRFVLSEISKELEDEKSGWEVLKTLLDIRIPLIKCTDKTTKLEADISFSNAVMHEAKTQLLRKFSQSHALVRVLILTVKYWSGQRKIRDSFMLNSYAWTLLTIQFLQVKMPFIFQPNQDQNVKMHLDNLLKHNVAGILRSMCKFYCQFPWERYAVCVARDRPMEIKERAVRTIREHQRTTQGQGKNASTDPSFPSLQSALGSLELDNNSKGPQQQQEQQGDKDKGKGDDTKKSKKKKKDKEKDKDDPDELNEFGLQKGHYANMIIEDPIDPTDNVARNLREYQRTQILLEMQRALRMMSSSSNHQTCTFQQLCRPAEWVILQFLVNGSRMGAVIGTKGANLERIRCATGVRVNKSQKESVKWRYLRLDGRPDCVLRAASMMLHKMALGRPPTIKILLPTAHAPDVLERVNEPLMHILRRRSHVLEYLPENSSKDIDPDNYTLTLSGPHSSLNACLKIVVRNLMEVGGNENGRYELPRKKTEDEGEDDGEGGAREEETDGIPEGKEKENAKGGEAQEERDEKTTSAVSTLVSEKVM